MKHVTNNRFWKLYLWVLFVFLVLSLPEIIFFPISDIPRYLNWLFYISVIHLVIQMISLVGLYGFTYKVALIGNLFWKVIFVLFIAFLAWEFAKFINFIGQTGAPLGVYLISSLGWLIELPLVYALWSYAFGSRKQWKQVHNKSFKQATPAGTPDGAP